MLIMVLSLWWYFKQQSDHLFYLLTFFILSRFSIIDVSCFDKEGNSLKWVKKAIKYIYF